MIGLTNCLPCRLASLASNSVSVPNAVRILCFLAILQRDALHHRVDVRVDQSRHQRPTLAVNDPRLGPSVHGNRIGSDEIFWIRLPRTSTLVTADKLSLVPSNTRTRSNNTELGASWAASDETPMQKKTPEEETNRS